MHGILACAGAAGSGQRCTAGAAGAAASSLLTNLFTEQPGETNAQKEAKRNLITSLVAGVAGIASSTNASTATNAATIAVDNNYLTQQQKQARAEALSECKTPGCQKDIRDKYAKLYEANRRRVMNCSTPEECRNIAKELREEQSAQGKRMAELVDKAKFGNGLSDAEQMELADLRLADTSINQMRSYAISNAARADGATPLGDTEQQLLAGEIRIGAASAIGGMAGGRYQPNAGAVGNMGEFLRSPGFGSELSDVLKKTNYQYQGQSVYQVTSKVGDTLRKGDQLYLDGAHKNHIEVFDSNGNFRFALNLDGSINDIKTKMAENRRLTR